MKLFFVAFLVIFAAVSTQVNADRRRCTKKFEVFDTCGNPCMDACDRIFIRCAYQCVADCYCDDGYCRDNNGACIPYPW
ncbi:hypothetical protein ACKWTF_000711 [Chironomus riparius]